MTDALSQTDAELEEEYRQLELKQVRLINRMMDEFLKYPTKKVPAALLAANTAMLTKAGRLGKAKVGKEKDESWRKAFDGMPKEMQDRMMEIQARVNLEEGKQG